MNSFESIGPSLPSQFFDIEDIAGEVLHGNYSFQEGKEMFVSLVMYHRYADLHHIPIVNDINNAIDILSTAFNIPPVITYESLILLNNLHDSPMVFSEEYRDQELLFYKIHQEIEYLFFQIYTEIQSIYLNQENNISMSNIIDIFGEIIKKLHTLMRDMSTDSFDIIRPYWDLSNYSRKDENGESYPGPSGAYTCGFVYLDLVLGNKSIDIESYSMDDRMLPSIRGNPYITKYDLDELKGSIQEKGLLSDILKGQEESIGRLRKQLLRFRLGHMQAARKYIGDQNLKRPGTGGAQNAQTFLTEHIENTKINIQENL